MAKQNKNIHIAKLDLTDEASIKAAAEKVAKLAPHGIDILINNAAISGDGKPVDNLTMYVLYKFFGLVVLNMSLMVIF